VGTAFRKRLVLKQRLRLDPTLVGSKFRNGRAAFRRTLQDRMTALQYHQG